MARGARQAPPPSQLKAFFKTLMPKLQAGESFTEWDRDMLGRVLQRFLDRPKAIDALYEDEKAGKKYTGKDVAMAVHVLLEQHRRELGGSLAATARKDALAEVAKGWHKSAGTVANALSRQCELASRLATGTIIPELKKHAGGIPSEMDKALRTFEEELVNSEPVRRE